MNYMNLKNLTLLFVTAFLGMSLTGCNAKKENTTQEEMARGSYSVEKNQVTVVPLERKTFNKQLICNGKLEAYSKVNLQFAAQGVVAGCPMACSAPQGRGTFRTCAVCRHRTSLQSCRGSPR